jgi:L-galactose dehydrogenase/L-glyceraldehyde 3-phosphate reductase
MDFRMLGRTGLSVSRVGLGGAGLGHAWGETTDAECVRTVRRALDLGVNFFDTSPVYGRGRSEENLGRGLSGQRHRVHIATKVRLQTEEEVADPQPAVRRSLEQSLRRLQTDYVDLLQIHHQVGLEGGQYVAAAADPPRYAYRLTLDSALALGEAMSRLVKEGAVRFLGITAWDGHPGVVEKLLASGVFHSAQVLYNLLNRTADTPPPPDFDDVDQGRVIPAAKRHDIGVIGIRSHAAGALADRLDRLVKPDSEVARDFARSRRHALPTNGPYRSLSQVALRFCLDHPGIATVVPGAKNAAELEEAVGCLELPPLEPGYLAGLQSR